MKKGVPVSPGIAVARAYCVDEVLARREEGYEVIGFVGNDRRLLGQSLINPRVIGMVSDLEQIVHRYHADRVVIAVGDGRGHLPLESLLELKLRDDVAIEESAVFYERLTGKISTGQLRPSQLIFASSSRWPSPFAKRLIWRPRSRQSSA